ncbi:MAG TPA: methylmalonyl-CoA mutase family protein, partial [Nitrospiria bacterium]|nr:methylmalonyl-CoA mutase family protein [Nitrospiria bacterium]
KSRDQKLVLNTLERLKEAAKGDENLIPFIIACAQSKATLGEISDTLRDLFGTYKGT